MSSNAPSFDPAKFKETTRVQWQAVAEAWHRWAPTRTEWLGEATAILLDMAGLRPDQQVLDVAAGAGDQALLAARRVGPGGHVLATDISSNILEYALQSARAAGLANVETRVMDAENLELPENFYDVVISRLGLMFLPNRKQAFAGIHRVLKPGGHLGAMVFSTPERNRFFSTPISIIRQRAHLPPPAPGTPGPFSLGGPGVLQAACEQAGFRNVEIKHIFAPLRTTSAAECVRFQRESFGGLHQMLAGLPEAERESVWQEIEREAKKYEGPGGFSAPCELILGVGTK
jgi:SAM-dependent methyltransferase